MTHEPVKLAAAACSALALVAVVLTPLLGWQIALSLAAGLLMGAANGALARRALGLGLGFAMTSLGRLAIVSAAALAAGFLIGSPVAALAGVAVAQLTLALSAAYLLARR